MEPQIIEDVIKERESTSLRFDSLETLCSFLEEVVDEEKFMEGMKKKEGVIGYIHYKRVSDYLVVTLPGEMEFEHGEVRMPFGIPSWEKVYYRMPGDKRDKPHFGFSVELLWCIKDDFIELGSIPISDNRLLHSIYITYCHVGSAIWNSIKEISECTGYEETEIQAVLLQSPHFSPIPDYPQTYAIDVSIREEYRRKFLEPEYLERVSG